MICGDDDDEPVPEEDMFNENIDKDRFATFGKDPMCTEGEVAAV
jgi:hypothetical protein